MTGFKDRPVARRWLWIVAGAGALALCPTAWDKAFSWGDDVPSQKWPNNKKINVFLPEHPDPANATANDQVKEGIERWTDKITTPYGISFNFHMNAPGKGDPTANRVELEWVDDGALGDDEGEGAADADGTSITGGTIKIEKDNKSGDGLKNLAMHEWGHIMGLDDDATADGQPHNCMDHNVPSKGTMGFSARDNKEIESLYGTAADKEQAAGDIESSSSEIAPGVWEYQYFVSWTSGPEIPLFETWIDMNPAGVVVIAMPPGWELDFPPVILDGVPIPTPTPLTQKLHFFAVDPAAPLQATNPIGQFVIHAPWPPGPGTAHAMIGGTSPAGWTIFDVLVPAAPCPTDVNGDGVTNVLDLIELLLCFGQPAIPPCDHVDIVVDGNINVLDLIELLLQFGIPCP
ncbi:MAG: hypothetical protein ACYSXF_04455 [Planctomycetota bacterium]|jgi:hypothetical protein